MEELDSLLADCNALLASHSFKFKKDYFTHAPYTLDQFIAEAEKNNSGTEEFTQQEKETMRNWPEPVDDKYVNELPPGARRVARELGPVFELFGVKADFSNFMATTYKLTYMFQSEDFRQNFMRSFMKYTFAVYDADKSGFMDEKEMTQVVRDTLNLVDPVIASNDKIVAATAKKLFSEADVNKDGLVSIDEFIDKFVHDPEH